MNKEHQMKTILMILTSLALCAGLTAHPAKSVILSFNSTTQVLNLTFDHPVKDAGDHFISKVIVKVGDKTLVEQSLGKQDNVESGSLFYKLNSLKPGDKLTVTTECNKGGKLSENLVVQ
jgi:hypothetical protein